MPPPAARLSLAALPPAILIFGLAAEADAPEEGSSVSPYLRRPLRSLKEAEKARERNRGKQQPEKDPGVSDRR